VIFGWTPRIGDPSGLGWFTVVSYFSVGLLCLRAANHDANAKNFWRMLGLGLFLLGVNKQLDLQSLLTQVGRELAHSGDWYERRRELQQLFVGVVAITLTLAAVAIILMFRNRSLQFRMASIGFVLLMAFVCVRAASFHHVDSFLKLSFLGARFNWIIELAGISLIGLAAVRTRRTGPHTITPAG
jgi:hypothetical protein